MKCENFRALDIHSFNLFHEQGAMGTLYEDGNHLIKVLDNLSYEEKGKLYQKACDMDELVIKNVLLPDILYVKNERVEAYSIEKLKNFYCFKDYFCCNRFVSCDSMFSSIQKASLILKDIHKEKIIGSDISFENIMINKEGDVRYIDFFDNYYYNCDYDQYGTHIISGLLGSYMQNYRKQEYFSISENTDRLSFLLSFYELIYLKEIEKTSTWQYHKLSNHIVTLQNAEHYRNMLLDKNHALPEIPYVHEFIDRSDDYIIDRLTQVSPLQKVKDYINERKK